METQGYVAKAHRCGRSRDDSQFSRQPINFGAEAEPSEPIEGKAYESSNTIAAASNSAGSLPTKPNFDLPALPVDEATVETSLQPVREVEPRVEQRSLELQAENGISGKVVTEVLDTTVNGTSVASEVKETTYDILPSQTPRQAESEISSMHESAAPKSSFPASISIDSSAPSSIPTDTQMSAATTILPSETPGIMGDAPTYTEQTPISNLRTSPPPEPMNTGTALRLKDEKEQLDLVADSELAQSMATDVDMPMETLTSEAQPVAPTTQDLLSSNERSESTTVMEVTSETAPVSEAPPASPPPAPQPEPAALVEDVTPASPPPAPQPAPAVLPADQPREPAPTPVIPTSVESEADHQMVDAPTPPSKVSREREEDADDLQPAAKRTKTEMNSAGQDFKMPDVPQTVKSPEAQPNDSVSAQSTVSRADDKITPPRLAHMKKIISNLKKSGSSNWFRAPVDYVGLNIPNYPLVIKHPMDVGTIDTKLKNGGYSSVKEFVDDFALIASNSLTFNGPDHAVTVAAMKMQTSFNNQMAHMPPAAISEPPKEEKKEAKVKEPTRTAPLRRQSIPATPAPAPPARSASGSGQTFALNPEGVPTIRRDSTTFDGRPKRAIKPTRNHDIGGVRPRKKKYELELKFCQETLNELKKPKHWAANQYFMAPVDPIALQIPTYFQIIKKPMDLSTVQHKLDANEYEKATDFAADVRLIFSNCFKFNKPGDYVFQCGKALEKLFDEQWEKMGPWIADRQPTSEPQSAGEEDDEDEESEEEEADDSEDERQEKIAQLQRQMEAMSKHMSELAAPKKKKKSTPPVLPTKKSSKSKGAKKEKPSATFPALQQKDKKKPAVKAKPEKERYVSYNEKQYISNGITQLDERRMNEALRIIQNSVPTLANSDQTEVELDIDELPNTVLLKLLSFLKKYVPQAPPEPPSEPAFTPAAAPSKPKKNKPMTKHEQEKQIEELKGKLADYNGGPISPDAGKSCHSLIVHSRLLTCF